MKKTGRNNVKAYIYSVIRQEYGQTLGKVRVRKVVIISLQWMKSM